MHLSMSPTTDRPSTLIETERDIFARRWRSARKWLWRSRRRKLVAWVGGSALRADSDERTGKPLWERPAIRFSRKIAVSKTMRFAPQSHGVTRHAAKR